MHTGLDVLASAKREESKVDGGFRVPKDSVASFVSSIHEEEKSELSSTDEDGDDAVNGARTSNRHYRDPTAREKSFSGNFYFILYVFLLHSSNLVAAFDFCASEVKEHFS